MEEYNGRIDLIRLQVVKDKSLKYKVKRFNNPQIVFDSVKKLIGEADREYLFVINLNVKNEPCSIEVCSMGSLTSTMISPREVFKSAIIRNADKIMIAHNHPSGSVEPSNSDIMATQALVKASKIIGISLIDHIIVGDSSYFSFAENSLLGEN